MPWENYYGNYISRQRPSKKARGRIQQKRRTRRTR